MDIDYLVITILFMCVAAAILYYIGVKVSYSYILYTPSITLGGGVISYLGKLLLLDNPVVLDLFILSILLAIWFFAVIEAVIIDVFEQGKEMKEDAKYIVAQLSTYNIKWIMNRFTSSLIATKIKKSFLIKFPLKLEE